jgi:hypothetical protein
MQTIFAKTSASTDLTGVSGDPTEQFLPLLKMARFSTNRKD